MTPGNEFAPLEPEGPAHVRGPGAFLEFRLARRILRANDRIGLHAKTEPSTDPLGEKEGLVVPPLPKPPRVQGNGHEEGPPALAPALPLEKLEQRRGHPPRERGRGGPPSPELEKAHEREERVVRIEGRNERNGRGGDAEGRAPRRALEEPPALAAEHPRRHPDAGDGLEGDAARIIDAPRPDPSLSRTGLLGRADVAPADEAGNGEKRIDEK